MKREIVRFICLGLTALSFILTGPTQSIAQTPEIKCDTSTRQYARATYTGIRQGQLKLSEQLPGFDLIAKTCPTDRVLLHYAALANTLAAGQTGQNLELAAQLTGKGLAFSKAYSRAPEGQDETRFMPGAGSVGDVRKRLILNMFMINAQPNMREDYVHNRPADPACDPYIFWEASAVRAWLRENPDDTELGIAFVEKGLETCPISQNEGRLAYKSLTAVKLNYAKSLITSDPHRVRELVRDIELFRNTVLEGTNQDRSHNWNEFDAQRLSEIKQKLPTEKKIKTGQDDPLDSAGPLPTFAWFSPISNVDDVHESIGRTLNVFIIQEGEAAGFARAMGKMYKLAEASSDADGAKLTLYEALQNYGNGAYRTAETKEVNIAPAYYDWLKPK